MSEFYSTKKEKCFFINQLTFFVFLFNFKLKKNLPLQLFPYKKSSVYLALAFARKAFNLSSAGNPTNS